MLINLFSASWIGFLLKSSLSLKCSETRACKYTCLIAYFIGLHVTYSSYLKFLLKETLNYFAFFILLIIHSFSTNIGHYLVDILIAYKGMDNYGVW